MKIILGEKLIKADPFVLIAKQRIIKKTCIVCGGDTSSRIWYISIGCKNIELLPKLLKLTSDMRICYNCIDKSLNFERNSSSGNRPDTMLYELVEKKL